MKCRFCNINLEQNRILKEGKYTRVIFSNPRLMPGHLLVIPKRHVIKISELSEEEQKELFDTIVEFQEKILKNVASGCDVRQNCRGFQKENFAKTEKMQNSHAEHLEDCSEKQKNRNYSNFSEEDDLKVDHLHVHIIPRELFDNLYEKCQIYEKDIFEKVEINELIKIGEKLR